MKSSLILVLTLLALPVLATKYAAPEAKEIYSENGGFYAKLSAKADTHEVFARDGKKALWTFNYSRWHDEVFVSDDGNRVIVVKWKHFKTEQAKSPAILVFKQGEKERTYSYGHLCTPRKRGDREIGPIGDFWRIWKEKDSTVKEQKLTVTVAGGKTVVIDLKTGRKL